MPHIYTTITVDWDGVNLDDNNLLIMQTFNEIYPYIPITHFICPTYFTRTTHKSEIASIAKKMNAAIKDSDEVTLHIHCWYSLMMASHIVPFRVEPLFAQEDVCVNTPGKPWGSKDCGHGVPLGVYSVEEIRRILQTGRQLLIQAGVKNTTNAHAFKSFRCGGWMACDKVLAAVKYLGYLYEASAAPSRYYSNVLQPADPTTPMFSWVAELWSGTTRMAPSYRANVLNSLAYPDGVTAMEPMSDTTPISNPVRMNYLDLIQIPDTGSLADYTPENRLQTYIEAAVKQMDATGRDVFISMGWHEGTATHDSTYHPDVPNIRIIMNILNNNRDRLAFCTVEQAALYWQAAQLATPVFPREEELVRLTEPVVLPHIPVKGRGIIHG